MADVIAPSRQIRTYLLTSLEGHTAGVFVSKLRLAHNFKRLITNKPTRFNVCRDLSLLSFLGTNLLNVLILSDRTNAQEMTGLFVSPICSHVYLVVIVARGWNERNRYAGSVESHGAASQILWAPSARTSSTTNERSVRDRLKRESFAAALGPCMPRASSRHRQRSIQRRKPSRPTRGYSETHETLACEIRYIPRVAIAGGIEAARNAGQITANWLKLSTMTAPTPINSVLMRVRARLDASQIFPPTPRTIPSSAPIPAMTRFSRWKYRKMSPRRAPSARRMPI